MDGSTTLLRLAPAIFAFLWSTGWLAARYAAPYSEPLTFLAARFALAAATLAALAFYLRVEWPRTRTAIYHSMVCGVLMQAMYVGGVWWSVMHGLPVAISGLISALQPILTALFAPAIVGETISRRQWTGIALGFLGILLVLGPALGQIAPGKVGETLLQLAVNSCAMFAITFGTFYQKRFVTSGHLVTTTAWQFVGATIAVLPVALALETLRLEWNVTTTLTMIWSVLGNSIISIILLIVLIRNGAVSRAAMLVYLMPPLVAVEAYILFGERMTLVQIVGIIITTIGVALAVQKAQS